MYWDDAALINITGQGANNNNTTGAGVKNTDTGQVSPGHAWNGDYGSTVITTFPAPSNAGTGTGTPTSNDDDFGNVRIMNTWFWPVQEAGSTSSFSIPNCRPEPDVNETFINVAVSGNVSSNDNVGSGSTYGTPVAANGNPAATLPVMTSTGTYTFTPTVTTGKSEAISIYPNPAIDIVYIHADDITKISGAKLSDIKGRVVYQTDNVINGIHLNGLTQGVYLLQIEEVDGKSTSFRLVKND